MGISSNLFFFCVQRVSQPAQLENSRFSDNVHSLCCTTVHQRLHSACCNQWIMWILWEPRRVQEAGGLLRGYRNGGFLMGVSPIIYISHEKKSILQYWNNHGDLRIPHFKTPPQNNGTIWHWCLWLSKYQKHRIVSNVFHNSTVSKISGPGAPKSARVWPVENSQQSDDMRCNDFYSKQLRNPNIRHLVSLKIRYPMVPWNPTLQTSNPKCENLQARNRVPHGTTILAANEFDESSRASLRLDSLLLCQVPKLQRVLARSSVQNNLQCSTTTLNQKYLSICIVCM